MERWSDGAQERRAQNNEAMKRRVLEHWNGSWFLVLWFCGSAVLRFCGSAMCLGTFDSFYCFY